jgi:hypothetical protein
MKVIVYIFSLLLLFQLSALAMQISQEGISSLDEMDEEFYVVQCDNLSFILPIEAIEDDLEQDIEDDEDLVWTFEVEFDDKLTIDHLHRIVFQFKAKDKLELAFTFSSFSEKYFTPPDFV